MILPLVKSYGVISTLTLSPGRIFIKFFLIFPDMWARISCPFSSSTRNIAFGSDSSILPSNSITSFDIVPSLNVLLFVNTVFAHLMPTRFYKNGCDVSADNLLFKVRKFGCIRPKSHSIQDIIRPVFLSYMLKILKQVIYVDFIKLHTCFCWILNICLFKLRAYLIESNMSDSSLL